MTYQGAAAWLRQHDRYLILTHKRPDGGYHRLCRRPVRGAAPSGKDRTHLPRYRGDAPLHPYLEGYLAPEGLAGAGDRGPPPTLPPAASSPGKGRWLERGIDLAIDHHPLPGSTSPGRSAWTPGGPPAASSSTTSCGNWARSRREMAVPPLCGGFHRHRLLPSTATPPPTPTGWRPP